MQTGKPEHQGRAVTYAWLIVAPLIGLGSFEIGFLSKHELAWGQRALAVGSLLLLLLALGVARLRFPVVAVKRKDYAYRRSLLLIIPAFLQNLVPHLLTTVLFPFLKQTKIGFLPLLVAATMGGGTFLFRLRPVTRFADRRDPALVTGLSALLAALAFGGLALGDPNLALYWTAVCIGAALALYIPGWNALIVRSLPQNERGEGWGAISTVNGPAIAVGPAVGTFA